MRSLIAALFSLAAFPALADAAGEAVLARWYGALAVVDREEIAALLDEAAVITLDDVGIEQTAPEFIDALDEWADAINGGSIRHRVTTQADGGLVAIVCYSFTQSALMTEERFTISDGHTTGSRQKSLADTCDAF